MTTVASQDRDDSGTIERGYYGRFSRSFTLQRRSYQIAVTMAVLLSKSNLGHFDGGGGGGG